MGPNNPKRRLKGRHPEYGHDPVTSDVLYDDAELEFLRAVDRYKSATGHRFPSLRELFHLLLGLGYRRIVAAESAANVIRLEIFPVSEQADRLQEALALVRNDPAAAADKVEALIERLRALVTQLRQTALEQASPLIQAGCLTDRVLMKVTRPDGSCVLTDTGR